MALKNHAKNHAKLPFFEWIGNAVHLAGVIFCAVLFALIGKKLHIAGAQYIGIGVYFALLSGANYIFAKNHWRGRSLFKQQNFQEALSCFERDFNKFTHAPHIEQLLFPVAFWYREKDLFYMVMCLNYLKDRNKAKTIFDEIKQHIPDTKLSNWAYECIEEVINMDSHGNVQSVTNQVQNISKND